MINHKIYLPVSLPYDLEATVLIHGWVNLMPFEWASEKKELLRKEYVHSEKTVALITVAQRERGNLELRIKTSKKLSGKGLSEVIKKIKRSLCTDMDTSSLLKMATVLDNNVAELVKKGGGRLLRGTTLFEDAVKTLFTTNASWEFTRQMVRKLVAEYGIDETFPTAHKLKHLSESQLRSVVRIGYRARYLTEIINIFIATEEAMILSNKIPGLGKYGFSHLKILAGDFSDIPIDSEVRKYCNTAFGCNTDSEIRSHFSEWGQFAFLGYKLGRQARQDNWIGI